MRDEDKTKGQLISELNMMRRLVELSPDAFFIQSGGKLVFANNAGVRLLGASSSMELLGQQILDVVSPTRWEDIKILVQDFLDEQKVPRIEKKFIRLDGKAIDVEVAAVPFTYKGKPAMQLVASDITKRKKAEEALRENENRFRHLVNNAPLGFIVLDTEGNITTVNPRIIQILGFSSEKILKCVNGLTYRPFKESGISDIIIKCIETLETISSEHFYKREDGKEIWLSCNFTPLFKNGIKLIGVQALIEDSTVKKKAEEELVYKNERINKELQLANTIQSSLFPINLPQIAGITLAATAMAANEVGGDYCDLMVLNNKKLGIAIGDVMGKGVPAALFTAMTYAFVRNYAFDSDNPSSLVTRLNRSLFPQLEFSEQFITFFYGIFDPDSRKLSYSNAGHNPPIIYRAEQGKMETLETRDFFLGGRQDANYREGECTLNSGDVILFYTDGLKEGKNKEKEQFGMERIINLLKQYHMHDPASIQEFITFEFTEFLAGEPPYDDVTMIVIKVD